MPTTTGWVNSDRRSELPPGWAALRAAALERDGHRCVAPWTTCGDPATDVDHIIPGNDHRLENLQSLCHPHHVEKTNAERVVFTQARPRERHPGEF